MFAMTCIKILAPTTLPNVISLGPMAVGQMGLFRI
jgi:hypothetical protein